MPKINGQQSITKSEINQKIKVLNLNKFKNLMKSGEIQDKDDIIQKKTLNTSKTVSWINPRPESKKILERETLKRSIKVRADKKKHEDSPDE